MGGNETNKKVLICFSGELYAGLKRSAEILGMSFSNFIRMTAAREAKSILEEYELDDQFDVEGWEMYGGGDCSVARAAKDPNYKKRTLSDKIDKAKQMAKERTNKRKGKENYG